MEVITGDQKMTIAEKLMQEDGEVKFLPVERSEIVDFFKKKTVLVTGAAGFLGKLLIEKLLRTCDEIETIYILIRPKKGNDVNERVKKLLEEPIFGPLRKFRPEFHKKIAIIKGDCYLPNLGLGETDRQTIIEKINVIFHVAATIRFDEKLKTAIKINVRSTRDLLLIARNCKKLTSFVHVSTAFAPCNRNHIDEVFYNQTTTAQNLIELSEQDVDLDKMTPRIIKGWPNTYVFTKSVAEQVIREFGKDLPISVFRPSIVIATYKEPLRSWIDNINGPTAAIIGAGLGVLHTLYCDGNLTAEIVPADYVINGMIATAYQAKTEKLTVYNFVSSVQNRVTWNDFMEQCSGNNPADTPFSNMIWYYSLHLSKFRIVHYFYVVTLHFLPAILMDLLLLSTGRKPKLLKIYWKIFKSESVISPFCTTEWKFSNDNTRRLWRKITDGDRKLFPFNLENMKWSDYHLTHALGLRTYVLKDNNSTLPKARIAFKRLAIFHEILKIFWYLMLAGILYVAWSW